MEKTICNKVVFTGKIVDIHHDQVVLDNGNTAFREIITHPGAVAILALRNGKMLLVRQFRYAVGHELLEIPAGKLEPGEKPEVAAVRELEEETGAVCDQMTLLGKYYGSPGILNEAISVYFANISSFKDAHPDEDELISTEEVEIAEFEKMLANGKISDGKTVFAFTIAAARGLLPGLMIDNSQSKG